MTFVNHGCNGSYNIDNAEPDGITEQNFDTVTNIASEDKVYNPFSDRRRRGSESSFDYATRDIKAGEEILCNYLTLTADPKEQLEEAQKLKRICNGEEAGDITNFEEENRSE
jgi:hypothetical protein